MFKRKAFTMIELIFVIVIMGIIGKFGIEFLAQAYKSFIFSKINHELHSTSEQAVEIIAKRLENRIRSSVIARTAQGAPPVPIASTSGDTYKVLEWVGVDNEGFRGTTKPLWSGIIDVDSPDANSSVLVSPETNTSAVSALIDILSNHDASIADAALYFVGANSNSITDYGWDGNITRINAQQGAMHPITSNGTINQFVSSTGTDFSGVDVYEYYKLAWSAYAIVYETGSNSKGTLRFYWNYQPWKGENFTNGNSTILMENVSTFQFMSVGSIMKIQVCTKSDLVEEYSLCKEKTIF